MKILLPLITTFVLLTSTSFAGDESIRHRAIPDKHVKTGHVTMTLEDKTDSEFTLKMNYYLKVKIFIFGKTIEGTSDAELPMKFKFPYGYEELEEAGSVKYRKVQLTHLGRITDPKVGTCHKVHLLPLTNNKWEAVLTYCPEVQPIGIYKTQLTYKKAPFIGTHTVHTELVEE